MVVGSRGSYEFTMTDLYVCVRQLQGFLDKYDEVPYKVIAFLSGQINYGGRVTDDWDRRTLMTILELYVTPSVLQEGYHFSSSGLYQTIPPTEHSGYLEHVQGWPINSEPEAFGLHENADITYARAETYDTLGSILMVEPKSASVGGKNKDETITDIAREVLAKVRVLPTLRTAPTHSPPIPIPTHKHIHMCTHSVGIPPPPTIVSMSFCTCDALWGVLSTFS